MADDDGCRCPWRPDQPCPWHPVGRDAEIVRLVALGWTDAAIGRALYLNPFTVNKEMARICRFLNIQSGERGSSARRTRLAAWAGRNGYGAAGDQGTVNTG